MRANLSTNILYSCEHMLLNMSHLHQFVGTPRYFNKALTYHRITLRQIIPVFGNQQFLSIGQLKSK